MPEITHNWLQIWNFETNSEIYFSEWYTLWMCKIVLVCTHLCCKRRKKMEEKNLLRQFRLNIGENVLVCIIIIRCRDFVRVCVFTINIQCVHVYVQNGKQNEYIKLQLEMNTTQSNQRLNGSIVGNWSIQLVSIDRCKEIRYSTAPAHYIRVELFIKEQSIYFLSFETKGTHELITKTFAKRILHFAVQKKTVFFLSFRFISFKNCFSVFLNWMPPSYPMSNRNRKYENYRSVNGFEARALCCYLYCFWMIFTFLLVITKPLRLERRLRWQYTNKLTMKPFEAEMTRIFLSFSSFF